MLSVLVEDHDFMCLSTHAAPQNTDTPEKYFWSGFVNKKMCIMERLKYSCTEKSK